MCHGGEAGETRCCPGGVWYRKVPLGDGQGVDVIFVMMNENVLLVRKVCRMWDKTEVEKQGII